MPRATSVGKRMSEPPPATELMAPATKATPATRSRSTADTSGEPTVQPMRKPGGAIWLAALLGGSGVLHLVRPRTYEWLVPPEVGDARMWVTGTGVAEIATAALLSPR